MCGQDGVSTSWPRVSKRSFQPSQLRGVSQRPWTRTTGGTEASAVMGFSCVVGPKCGSTVTLTGPVFRGNGATERLDGLDHQACRREYAFPRGDPGLPTGLASTP